MLHEGFQTCFNLFNWFFRFWFMHQLTPVINGWFWAFFLNWVFTFRWNKTSIFLFFKSFIFWFICSLSCSSMTQRRSSLSSFATFENRYSWRIWSILSSLAFLLCILSCTKAAVLFTPRVADLFYLFIIMISCNYAWLLLWVNYTFDYYLNSFIQIPQL